MIGGVGITMEHQRTFVGPRFEIRNYLSGSFLDDLSRDIFTGMKADQKFIPCKYFYDERGSILFEDICRLSEYYQTRTELSILEEKGEAIMEPFEDGDLVELGSGANWKICKLIDAADTEGENIRYVPVDVSESALVTASEELISKYKKLKVMGIVADFIYHMGVIPDDSSRLIIFFGSSIGNFDEVEGHFFLRNVADSMKQGDRFLIGLDMVKKRTVLEGAYNDSQGVTCEFNKNILHVINRELNADFDVSLFDHLAFFNVEKEQVEMHLVAKQDISVEIKDLDLSVTFEEGESVHTEICRKFTKEGAIKMFSEAGLVVEQWFTDVKGWFSVVELVREDF
jgi:L-histidine N-alpha-methyltransferase